MKNLFFMEYIRKEVITGTVRDDRYTIQVYVCIGFLTLVSTYILIYILRIRLSYLTRVCAHAREICAMIVGMKLWRKLKAPKIDVVYYSNGQNPIDHHLNTDGSYAHICCMCMQWIHETELFEDAYGQRWDFCIECAAVEERDKYGFL